MKKGANSNIFTDVPFFQRFFLALSFLLLFFLLDLAKRNSIGLDQPKLKSVDFPAVPELSHARIHIDTDRGRLPVAWRFCWGAKITCCNRGTPKWCNVFLPPPPPNKRKSHVPPKKGTISKGHFIFSNN